MRIIITFLLAFVFVGSLHGQRRQEPRKYVRFIALGEAPPWKEKLENGIRVQIPPPKWSLPPNPVSYKRGENEFKLKLPLRRVSKLARFGAESPIALYEGGIEEDKKPWISARQLSSRFSLGVMFRDPKAMTWENPKMLVLQDDARSFPVGYVRFINVSDVKMLVKLGEGEASRVLTVEPGKSKIEALSEESTLMKLGFRKGRSQDRTLFSNVLKLTRGHRANVYLFKAQGEKPRIPVVFSIDQETPPRPPRRQGQR